jgi:dihydrofolate reductase
MNMRKIIVGENVSLDGVMEAPEKWSFPFQNEETGKVVSDSMSACDALLLGRVTYQTFADAFSSQSGGMADIMNNFTKYAVSTTLKKVEWKNSILIKGNVAEEIAKLKRQPGKNIGVSAWIWFACGVNAGWAYRPCPWMT